MNTPSSFTSTQWVLLGVSIGVAVYATLVLGGYHNMRRAPPTMASSPAAWEGFADGDTPPTPQTATSDRTKDAGKSRTDTEAELRQVQVVNAFESVLQRAPTAEELRYYAAKMKTERLRPEELAVLLRATPEYTRLMLTQSNDANRHVPFRLADRSVTFMIAETYKEVYRRQPSPETMAFLAERFHALGQDRDAFTRFVLRMHEIETGKQGPGWIHCTRPDMNQRSCRGAAQPVAAPPQAPVPPPPRTRSKCTRSNETRLSDRLHQRNKQQMDAKCGHSKSGDMVLREDMKWSVPQKQPPVCVMPRGRNRCQVCPQQEQTALIGTLLGGDTAVGSIMSKFTYRDEP
jgi:hypothetical protein